MAFLVDGDAYFAALADAIEKAENSIVMLGWDFDSRTRLRAGGPDATSSDGFAAFITAVLAHKPSLHVYILAWDFAMIYALEREPLPLFKFGLRTHRRLHFHLDGSHPFGGSHHQKIVVVDDALAFVGGLDVTKRRWDTPEHLADDPRRTDPAGVHYPPFHDIQIMVDGETAQSLGELARKRWLIATGHDLTAVTTDRDPWPRMVKPDLERTYVAIARTEPAYRQRPETREVEHLFLDSIGSARHSIYVENQYFTSMRIAEALAQRLGENGGPEIVMVMPKVPAGLLEETTMGVLRARLLQGLKKWDAYGRLRVYFPVVPGLTDGQCLNVHSKVMIVDDWLVRVGSANLSNRSMGLDTECDLAIEAGEDGMLSAGIAAFRDRLIAEHLGTSGSRVAEKVAEKGSLVRAIEGLRTGGRTLEQLNENVPEWLDGVVPDAVVLDPERPIDSERLFNQIVAGEEEERVRYPFLKAGTIVVGLIALVLAWHYGPLREWFALAHVENFIASFRSSAAVPLVVVGAFMMSGFLMVPLTILILATALVFDPLPGFIYAMSGALAAASAGFAVGRLLGRDTVRRFAGERLNVLSRKLARRGITAVIVTRTIPLLPFTVVNLVAGASNVRFADFFIGSAIGLAPGILFITLFEKGLEHAVVRPGAFSFGMLAGIIVIVFLALRYLKTMLTSADDGRRGGFKQKSA